MKRRLAFAPGARCVGFEKAANLVFSLVVIFAAVVLRAA
jgi:hypothetical protein